MVYRYRALNCCHGIEMWKFFLTAMALFNAFFVLWDEKYRKKFGGVKNVAYYCI